MAKQVLHLINAQTQQELKLVKQNGVYKSGTEVFIGDLYRDPTNPDYAVIDVANKLHPEDLSSIVEHHLISEQPPVVTGTPAPSTPTQH